jgi:hypothetical protein
MDARRFDAVSRRFAALGKRPRLTRRQAMIAGGGLAATALAATGSTAGVDRVAVAQDATPAADPASTPAPDAGPGAPVEFLFVQTFQAGTIVPVEGVDGRYALTLEAGTGQTIYFADRPARDVGALATPAFLAELGFAPDNPPNAALVVEAGPGQTDVAVLELFSPVYDPVGRGVTYEVEVLANWQDELEMGFQVAPTDLAALAPSFGAAHLFIDGIADCKDYNLSCCAMACDPYADNCFCSTVVHDFGTVNYCSQYGRCVPCMPYNHYAPSYSATWDYWDALCNGDFPECQGSCESGYWVT